jgi:hypothetical protein
MNFIKDIKEFLESFLSSRDFILVEFILPIYLRNLAIIVFRHKTQLRRQYQKHKSHFRRMAGPLVDHKFSDVSGYTIRQILKKNQVQHKNNLGQHCILLKQFL